MSAADTTKRPTLTPAEVVDLADLVAVATDAVVSRTLVRSSGGSVTCFAFDAGQELSEHTAPFDALVQVVDGELEITIGGDPVTVGSGQLVLMPADVPHGLVARRPSRMLLAMLRRLKED